VLNRARWPVDERQTMSLNPDFADQETLAATLGREQSRMSPRERVVELVVVIGFALAVAALLVAAPPGTFALEPAILCVLVLAAASRVRFETPLGFTVATQLAFVPLVFAVPAAIVPIAVVVALMLARMPDLTARKVRARGLWLTFGNASFAIGPAIVFALAGTRPARAGIGLLVLALLAQFGLDFVVATIRFGAGNGARLLVQLRENWVYVIDAALAPVGLAVAWELPRSPLVALTPLPLLGLLLVFARERQQRLRSLLELNEAYRGTAEVLGEVVEADDGYTGEHCRGVVELALAVGERLNLPAERRRNLEFGALLHDIGKIAIPKDIINKPGPLDAEEWRVMRLHTIYGEKLLERVGGFMRDVGRIVRSHHERWDGSGYPDGLAAEAIPLEARIISVCDTWHAMRTDRSYRPALSYEEARAEVHRVAGSQLDPAIVDVLVGIVTPTEPALAPPRRNATLRDAAPEGTGRPVDGSPAATARPSRRATLKAGAARLLTGRPVHAAGQPITEGAARDPVERLLEHSWEGRAGAPPAVREFAVEIIAAMSFLAIAVPLAAGTFAQDRLPWLLTSALVFMYALIAGMIRFPIGAGAVVPSYLVLVPMLLLLPPGAVPLLCAAGLVGGAAMRIASGNGGSRELVTSIPDAWHTLGPAGVLLAAGSTHGFTRAGVYVAALLAGFVIDLLASAAREGLAAGVAPHLQLQVIGRVWFVDACLAPLGLLFAIAARAQTLVLLLAIPLLALLVLADRDRRARIAQSQHRLALLERERSRLQAAVQRLGDAFSAKLDLDALIDVLIAGSVDALDADAGRLVHVPDGDAPVVRTEGASELAALMQAATDGARLTGGVSQLEVDGTWALAASLRLGSDGDGALALAREGRAFGADEQELLLGLIERAERAAAEISAHESLRDQVLTDALTHLGNRRKLTIDLDQRLTEPGSPALLMLFDLDGFKTYNDTFGHVAGDALLARLGRKLESSLSTGSAYRLGGDEFCALLDADAPDLREAIAAAAGALEERGETFTITASCGTVLVPHEAATVDHALQLADERMYARKNERPSAAREQTQSVLLRIMSARRPDSSSDADGFADLAAAVGRRLRLRGEALDELVRAAALHDVGKVALPDGILNKPGPLDPEEWDFVREHPILGERILGAAPALRPIATIVRASHERWDGSGYPDGLHGDQIPLAARIIAACDAYRAITSNRSYRSARTADDARLELTLQAGHQFDPDVVAALMAELDNPTPNETGGTQASAAQRREGLAAAVAAQVDRVLQADAA
jgi:diguanylate cyclase (GGDEF)-like protein